MQAAWVRRWYRAIGCCLWWREFVTLSLFTALGVLFFTFSSFAQTPIKVEWRDGLVSVAAEKAPLSAILQEVARQTGIEIQGIEELQDGVSAHLSRVELTEGLQSLLADCDYALEGGSSGVASQPVRLVIFGQRATSHRDVTTVSAATKPRTVLTLEAVPQETTTVKETDELEPDDPEAKAEPDPVRRMGKLNSAVRRGDQDAVREAVLDSDPTVQASAFEALAAQDKDGAIQALLAAEKSDQASTRLEALQLLDQSSQADERTIFSVLHDALKDEDLRVRSFAIQALASHGGTEAMDDLRQALSDPDPSFRLMVISSVAQKDEGLPLLHAALSDPDESVSSLATLLLQQSDTNGK